MPSTLPRPCIDCGTPTRNGTRCPQHHAAAEARRALRRGTSTQRGYNTEHQRVRRQLLAQWKPGDPCAHCGGPMWTTDNLDLAHTEDRTGWRGLAHAQCNRGNR